MDKLIKEIKVFPSGSYCIKLNHHIKNLKDLKEYKKALKEIWEKEDI